MICYAVIDTNVLVSALLSKHDDSATVKVVEHLFDGNVIPLFSDVILQEYNSVLRRKKFGFSEELVQLFIKTIENVGKLVTPTSINEILPDMKDVPFYEVILEKQDDNAYLVTGNIKHFPKKPFIVTPNEFLEILINNK